MGQTLNSIRAAGQIRTSLLLLQFGLENGLFKSWASHESCRPMSYLSHPYKMDLNPRSTAPDMTQLPNSVPVWTAPASLF